MLLTNTMAHHNPDPSKLINTHTPSLQTRPFPLPSSIQQQQTQNISTSLFQHPHPHLSPSPYPSPFQPRFSPPVNKALTRPSNFPISSHHQTTRTQSKWRVTPDQKSTLSAAFHENPYPELARKTALAAELGVTTTQVSKWFQHRRESLTRLGQFKAQYNRTRRTPEELEALNRAFKTDHYPSAERLAELASTSQLLNVSPKQIKLWFKHKRKQCSKRTRTNIALAAPAAASPHISPVLSSPHPSNDLVPPPNATENRAPPSVNQDFAPVSPSLPALQHSHSQHNIAPTNLGTLASAAAPIPYPISPNYYYKSQPLNVSPFLEAELMALRGAFAVSNGSPPPDALGRLASMLGRPLALVTGWFRSQVGKPSDPGSDMGIMGGNFVSQEVRPSSSGGAFNGNHNLGYNTGFTGAGSLAAHSDGAGSQTPPLAGMTTTYETNGKELGVEEGKGGVESVPGSTGVYPGYVYPGGFSQPAVGFAQVQSTSAPLLAPLRYVPTSNVPYSTSSSLWYGPAPNYPKS